MSPEREALEAAVAETNALTESVQQLTDALVIAAERDARRWRRITALFVVLVFAFGYGYWREQNRVNRGVACLLGEMAAHRVDNRQSHAALADGHNLGLPPAPALPAPADTNRIVATCRPFYGKGDG